MDRAPGLSVRLKLTLSYAGFVMLAGALLLGGRVGVPPAIRAQRRDRHRPRHARLHIARPWRPLARFRSGRGHLGGVPAGVRSPGRVASRRPDARPPDPHHRRHPHGRDRIALPPHPATGPQRRVPRTRRRLRRHARPARSARRRTAEIRSQRLPRAAHPAGRSPRHFSTWPATIRTTTPANSSTASTSSTPGRSTSPKHCSCSAAPTSSPSPQNTSTCPSSPKKPRKRSSPSQKSAASPSKPPATLTPTIGSEALLLQLTTNLVHNAIVHNLPEQGTVWVTTSVHPNTVVLTVENTGEKLTPQTGFHAGRAVSARHRTHTHRPRRCRPRPGDRQEHHPGTRRNPHPHPPGRWRALRHGATTRQEIVSSRKYVAPILTLTSTGGLRLRGDGIGQTVSSGRAPLQVDRPDQHDHRGADGYHQRLDHADLAARHLPGYSPRPSGTRQYLVLPVAAHGVLAGDRGPGRQLRADRRHVRAGPHVQPGLRSVHRSRSCCRSPGWAAALGRSG